MHPQTQTISVTFALERTNPPVVRCLPGHLNLKQNVNLHLVQSVMITYVVTI